MPKSPSAFYTEEFTKVRDTSISAQLTGAQRLTPEEAPGAVDDSASRAEATVERIFKESFAAQLAANQATVTGALDKHVYPPRDHAKREEIKENLRTALEDLRTQSTNPQALRDKIVGEILADANAKEQFKIQQNLQAADDVRVKEELERHVDRMVRATYQQMLDQQKALMQLAFDQRVQDDRKEAQTRADICNTIPGSDRNVIKAIVDEDYKLPAGRYDVGDPIKEGHLEVSYDQKGNPTCDFSDLNFRNSRDREIAIDSMYAAGGAKEGRKMTLKLPDMQIQLSTPEKTKEFIKSEKRKAAFDLLVRASGMEHYASVNTGQDGKPLEAANITQLIQDYDRTGKMDEKAYQAYLKHYEKYGDKKLNLEIERFPLSPSEKKQLDSLSQLFDKCSDNRKKNDPKYALDPNRSIEPEAEAPAAGAADVMAARARI